MMDCPNNRGIDIADYSFQTFKKSDDVKKVSNF